MSTEALIRQLLDERRPVESVIDVLHRLLDDTTAEPAGPVGVAEAAAATGLSAPTLRYYEAEGLVRPGRDANGHRVYHTVDLRRLIFLTRMRLSGMGMRELTRYIRLVDQGASSIPERRQMMLEQRTRINARLRELHLALAATEYKIATYDGAPDHSLASAPTS